MSLTEHVVNLAVSIMGSLGYGGVVLLMALESMVAPVPSEAVMPFAGYLVTTGKFTFLGILLASTIGSIIGSVISYWIGRYIGRAFVDRFGKYVLLNHHHLDVTEQFFQKYGEKAVFFSRFIPIVRHFISIPAGVGEMKMGKFLLYTIIGAALWNAFLGWLGLKLGENWTVIQKFGHKMDLVIAVLIVCAIVYFVVRFMKNKKRQSTPTV